LLAGQAVVWRCYRRGGGQDCGDDRRSDSIRWMIAGFLPVIGPFEHHGPQLWGASKGSSWLKTCMREKDLVLDSS
jgi:hypothetical protein